MIVLIIALIIVAAAVGYCVWALRQVRTAETVIDLPAPAHRVWAVLTDFPAYGEWNPLITEISGQLGEQERLEVALAQPDGKTLRFRPTVLRVSPARQIRLLARFGPGGLLDGQHYFVLEPRSDGTTRLTHGERFTGLLVPWKPNLAAETEEQFTSMNEALLERIKTTGE